MKPIKITSKDLFIEEIRKSFPSLIIEDNVGKDKEAILMKSRGFLSLFGKWICQVLFHRKEKEYYVVDFNTNYFDNANDLYKFSEILKRFESK